MGAVFPVPIFHMQNSVAVEKNLLLEDRADSS